MALKIVTGGTTGAADGTLVSSSNKIVFTALDTVVDCHVRADDDTYSADASFSMPSDGAVQVSFDGGSTWKAFADNPASYDVDIGALNVAIKLRQHANASASTGIFQTDATTLAATALADVTGFTATGATSSTISLSWSPVTNRSFYQIDRATNSGFTTGVALDISPGLTSTTLTDTGRTAGTTYYYRIKAIGRVRYKDSAGYATGNGAPPTVTMGTDYASALNDESPYGICAVGTDTWAVFRGTGSVAKISSSGTITVYVIDASAGFFNICYGPDGNLWVTDHGLDKIRKISTAGSLLASYATTSGAGAFDICTDGTDLFFTENLLHKVSKITTGGTVTRYSLTGSAAPNKICLGPDGNLWTALTGTHKVAKVTPAGTVTEYALTGSAGPQGICSDGTKLWVSCVGTSKIAQVTTSGTETVLGTTVADARYLCADPDGNIWYTQATAGKVGVITAGGSFLTAQAIAHGTVPLGIVYVGGKAWFCVNYPGGAHKGYIGTATAS